MNLEAVFVLNLGSLFYDSTFRLGELVVVFKGLLVFLVGNKKIGVEQ